MTRYAIYFTPRNGSAWASFGSRWIGRDAYTGKPISQPSVPGLTPQQLSEATAFPRRYGFHATLKAPFELANDKTDADLISTFDVFASTMGSFQVPAPKLHNFHGYLTLMLSAPSDDVTRLADACVEVFDPFRAPLSEADQARRLKAPLTERQISYLETWGYPYVFEEFNFHMTMTSRLSNEQEIAALNHTLEEQLSELTADPFIIDGIALFRQATRDEPFTVLRYGSFEAPDRKFG